MGKILARRGVAFFCLPFGGECSSREIEKIVSEAKGAKADYFIAIGGGKAIDAARAAAEVLEMETVICPSIAFDRCSLYCAFRYLLRLWRNARVSAPP